MIIQTLLQKNTSPKKKTIHISVLFQIFSFSFIHYLVVNINRIRLLQKADSEKNKFNQKLVYQKKYKTRDDAKKSLFEYH